ncbi:hypothetical protein [Sphingomonas sp. OTU376]|uniref:hypothetical protein n=1 Tax=Sphingomonas sp. OTU376 TaxID=3043863 RepID=UPI00313D3A8F
MVIWISTVPVHDKQGELAPLWSELLGCHRAAITWSGPAEIATFGKDLKAMTEGAMLVLSYAATASKLEAGPGMYREAQAPESVESAENSH